MTNKQKAQREWAWKKAQIKSCNSLIQNLCSEFNVTFPSYAFRQLEIENNLAAKRAGINIK